MEISEDDTYLVTGGAGFIGSHVVDELLRRGARVVCIDNFDPYYDVGIKRRNVKHHRVHARYSSYENSICSGAALERIFTEEKPRAVIHLAALAGVRRSMEQPDLYRHVNVEGTRSVLNACAGASVKRVVVASSSSVYGDGSAQPTPESSPLTPLSPYGQTKLDAEQLCQTWARSHGMTIASLRFFTVYGARQRPDMAITRFARRLRRGEALPIYGDGTATRDFTHIRDIVQGILAATCAPFDGHQAFNLGAAAPVTILQLVETLGRLLGVQPILALLPPQAGDARHTSADISKAATILGYRPQLSLELGLRRFLDTMTEAPETHLVDPVRMVPTQPSIGSE